MADTTVTIYHNPRCSKSRKTLALLRDNGIEPTVVDYLKDTPDRAALKLLADQLGLKPEQLVRKGEEIFKKHYAGQTLNDHEWLDAMQQHPILIERPIVVKGDRAVLGRPPENVLDLI